MTADPALVTARISGPSAESAAHSPWSGVFDKLQTATLGEFQVIRELGRGGMAAVFLAHDIHLDRKVAIKVMSPMLASDMKMVERFRREAKTGAGLKHPNIGTVHRVLEGEGLYFFVMDFVRGRPLDAIIHRNGVLSVEATRAFLHQVGSGLAYAHRRKIYHRDVKPANVLVSAADGTAVVTDFGIAKVAESPNQTQTGAIVGTPAYMAPEQILGREITGAVDQYALGVMAYEMLTGAPPFVGTSFVVMHAHTEVQPRSIRESRPDCPQDLDDAVMRMLSKDPNQRWPSIPHALAAMGATMIGEDDPVREELVRLATPDDTERERFQANTPLSPPPPTVTRGANVAMVAISPPPDRIEVGDTFRLTASPRDMQGVEVPGVPIEWVTNADAVLKVQSDGTITALAVGPAEISAMAGRARGAVLISVESSRVADVQLSIPPGTLMAGDRIQLSARVMDKHRRSLGYQVRWAVGDPNIARVSPEGVLEARSPGLVDVYAESNGVRSVARVQIAPPAVAAVQLVCEPQRPVVGDLIKVTATPVDAHGRPVRDRALGWSLSDLSLVTIVSDGVYEAVASGTLRVTAASEGKSATIDIAIAPAPVAGIKIAAPPGVVIEGGTFKLVATAVDARGRTLPNRRITWSASDAKLASVSDDGTVTTLHPGDVRIVANCEGKAASIAVTIKPAPVGAVKISGVPHVIYVKAPFRLTATVTDTRGRQVQKGIEWRSANVAVANVNKAGQVTAISVGQARIIATVDGVEGFVDIGVVEPAIPKVVVVPTPPPPTPAAQAPAPRAPEPVHVDYSASAIFTPQASRPAPTSNAPTPVVAPAVPSTKPRNDRRLLIGLGAATTIALVAAVVLATRSEKEQAVVAPDTVATVVHAPRPDSQVAQASTKRDSVAAPVPVVDSSKKTNAKTVAKTPPPTRDAPVVTPPAPVVERDVFRVSVASQSPMRVGETVILRASVERVSGAAALPRVTWESSRPNVLRVDANGVATAVAEGQAVVSAVGGGTRGDVTITVQAAPVVAPPPATRANPPAVEAPPPTRPAGPSSEEIRARGETALKDAANAMASALRAKNTTVVAQLLGDGQNADASDLLRELKDYLSVQATATPGAAQVTDRAGSMEYKLELKRNDRMGIPRTKTLTIRAEAERNGETWSVVRQRIVAGWR